MFLENLVVSEEELNEKILEEILIKYIRFGKESGSIIFTPAARKIPIRSQLLVYLVARKAYLKIFPGKKNFSEEIKATEITKALGINSKTLSARLSELKREGMLKLTEKGYAVKNAFLNIIANELQIVKSKTVVKTTKGRLRSKSNYRPEILQKIAKIYSDEKYWKYFKKESPLKLLDKYMLVLRIAKDAEVESLTPEEVRIFLTEPPINLPSKIYASNISRDFGKNREFVTPQRLGKGNIYRLTRLGEEHLDKLLRKEVRDE